MPRLVYLDAARRDLAGIARFILAESGSRDVALRFTAKLRAQCRMLASAETSQRGTDRSDLIPGLRSDPFGNYMIFFRYRADRLEIVNILERHRDIEARFRTPV